MTNAPCLEVAVYDVSDGDTFGELHRLAHRELSAYPGYLAGVALRGLEEASLRADLALWASLADAKAAAERIQSDPKLAAFLKRIDTLRHLAHYDGATTDGLHALAAWPVVEIAAYVPKHAATTAELQRVAHAELAHLEGTEPGIIGGRLDAEDGRLDLMGWSAKATQQAAPAILQQRRPELGSFFTGIETMHVFELFERQR